MTTYFEVREMKMTLQRCVFICTLLVPALAIGETIIADSVADFPTATAVVPIGAFPATLRVRIPIVADGVPGRQDLIRCDGHGRDAGRRLDVLDDLVVPDDRRRLGAGLPGQ